MKITREELEVVAKECGFDLTFRLEKFARLAIEAVEADKAMHVMASSTPYSQLLPDAKQVAQMMASPAGLLALA